MTVKHSTASVFVFCKLAPGWRLGLIQHPLFGRLMIPGGHVEPDESQQQAALREVSEEAGLRDPADRGAGRALARRRQADTGGPAVVDR